MTSRVRIGAVAMAAASLMVVTVTPSRAASVCTWGGSPQAPTATFSISPGLHWTPAPAALDFVATGPASGDGCGPTVTFTGQLTAGSSCGFQYFQGTVDGIPGVEFFWGWGGAPMVHEFLYDAGGELAGFDNPTAVNQSFVERAVTSPKCNTTEGYTDGSFSGTIALL